MAITKADLTSQSSTSNVASYATASSYTPSSNALVLALVVNTRSASAGTPTFSGNGLTWVQIDTQANAAGTLRATLFRAMGASPTNGAGTADFGGANQSGCLIHVWEHGGVDTSGTNGSGAIVQSAKNTAAATASLTVTLSAFGSANNGAAAGFGAADDVGMTPEWTEIFDNTYATPDTGAESQWRSDNDTTVTATMASGTPDMVGIAVEIKAAGGTDVTVVDPAAYGSAEGPVPSISSGSTLTSPQGLSSAFVGTPAVSAGSTLSAPAGEGSSFAPVPTLSAGSTLASPYGDGSAFALIPTISVAGTVQVSSPEGVGTAFAPVPAVSAGVTITTPIAAASLIALAPSVSVAGAVLLNAPPASISLWAPYTPSEVEEVFSRDNANFIRYRSRANFIEGHP